MAVEVGNILATIASMEPVFTKAERKVATLLLGDPQIITYGIISDVAARADVCDTTVVRFCNKLGYKGYYDFRIALAQEVYQKSGASTEEEPPEEGTGLTAHMKTTLRGAANAMEETISMAREEDLVKAVNLIEQAARVFFYGIGFSGVACQYGKYKFLRGGLSCDAFTEGHFMAINSSLLTPQDVVIVLSFSGSTIDVLNAVKLAKDQAASVISITHYLKSPITLLSDVVLISAARENALQSGTFSTFMTQAFLLDALYIEYFRRHPDKLNTTSIKSLKAVSDKVR